MEVAGNGVSKLNRSINYFMLYYALPKPPTKIEENELLGFKDCIIKLGGKLGSNPSKLCIPVTMVNITKYLYIVCQLESMFVEKQKKETYFSFRYIDAFYHKNRNYYSTAWGFPGIVKSDATNKIYAV